MGIFDKAKEALKGATDKAEDLRESVGGVVEEGINKAADAANTATKGRFEEQIDKVKDMADKIDGVESEEPSAAEEPAAEGETPA